MIQADSILESQMQVLLSDALLVINHSINRAMLNIIPSARVWHSLYRCKSASGLQYVTRVCDSIDQSLVSELSSKIQSV